MVEIEEPCPAWPNTLQATMLTCTSAHVCLQQQADCLENETLQECITFHATPEIPSSLFVTAPSTPATLVPCPVSSVTLAEICSEQASRGGHEPCRRVIPHTVHQFSVSVSHTQDLSLLTSLYQLGLFFIRGHLRGLIDITLIPGGLAMLPARSGWVRSMPLSITHAVTVREPTETSYASGAAMARR